MCAVHVHRSAWPDSTRFRLCCESESLTRYQMQFYRFTFSHPIFQQPENPHKQRCNCCTSNQNCHSHTTHSIRASHVFVFFFKGFSFVKRNETGCAQWRKNRLFALISSKRRLCTTSIHLNRTRSLAHIYDTDYILHNALSTQIAIDGIWIYIKWGLKSGYLVLTTHTHTLSLNTIEYISHGAWGWFKNRILDWFCCDML